MKKRKPSCAPYIVILLLAALLMVLVAFHTRGHILRYFYPLDYRVQVEAMAEEYELDPWLVFAMIRVESSFDARAESQAGACGLMQLMPTTAEWIAKTAGFELSEGEIWRSEINIRLGCWYINWLRDYYDGDMVAALAAYNAGMSNVDAWLADGLWDGELATRADIPFAQTRRYVGHVYESYDMYLRLYGE